MNLLRSICCLIGGSCPSEHQVHTKETARTEPPVVTPTPVTPPTPPSRPTGPQATEGGSQATRAAEQQN
jgi:hypothetical protein